MVPPTPIPAEGQESKPIVVSQFPFGSGWFGGGHLIYFWTTSLKGKSTGGVGWGGGRPSSLSSNAVVEGSGVGAAAATSRPHDDKLGDKSQHFGAGR